MILISIKNKLFVVFLFILFLPSLVFGGVPNKINYQGRLRESEVGVTGNRTFKFNIYDADSGGNLLWTSNDQIIFVSSGVFNYVLVPDVDWRKQDLWIETLVGGSILIPRQKITSNAYALHSKTAEGITLNFGTIDLTIGSETSALSIENSQIKCLTANATYYMVPKGFIGMWSGNPGDIPDGWTLCDGTNGTPDLRGRFVVSYYPGGDSSGDYNGIGAGETVDAGNTSGNRIPGGEKTHTLSTSEMPSHTHTGTTNSAGTHSHTYTTKGGYFAAGGTGGSNYWGNSTSATTGVAGAHTHNFTTNSIGGENPHENRPPYYVLAYIMRL